MVRLLNNITVLYLLFLSIQFKAQDTILPSGAKNPVYKDYKADSSFSEFHHNREDVAKAQIVKLKQGALLVRLRTNQKAIDALKSAGNIDLATQVERETFLKNKMIVSAFIKEFHFCPVYFFYSNVSDSVKHKNIQGVFLDTNLQIDPHIICRASFYLIAEQGEVVNSSLGIVSLMEAPNARETGVGSKEAAIVLKNRFFIQLHKPFPYYTKGYKLKKYPLYVKKLDAMLQSFYQENKNYVIPQSLENYVY